eukprot:snap_masked-scaffold_24-processed-gene-2.47-mRNA-1 protein AED:1.00 eAED:1.00 QI:0/-1/0/0/-1/1/1/0/119
MEFQDGTTFLFEKTAKARVILTQGKLKLALKPVEIFLINSDARNDVLIGKTTMERNGITLDITSAPKPRKLTQDDGGAKVPRWLLILIPPKECIWKKAIMMKLILLSVSLLLNLITEQM